ncbi:MAG: FkbM family methyltransferase [Flavobacteriaceae bacterium]|nr:FkbM family methyltransferase [Flavobacteriaceae bacterium]
MILWLKAIMMKFIKNRLKKFLIKNGYKVSKINNHVLQDENPFLASKNRIHSDNPIIFDIGMNHGQSLRKIRAVFPNALIHGFEPSKYCFKDLKKNFSHDNCIVLNNLGIGDKRDVLELNEYSWDALNSFLKRAYGKAQIIETYQVNVTTIDDYAENNNINSIHILKSDTEGFELKVLKGAEKLMDENKIQFIYLELFFDLNFIGQSLVGEIFSYLEKKNFSLIRLYDFSLTQEGLASKSDALFINKNFK